MKATFEIDDQDLRILFLKTSTTEFSTKGFKLFIKEIGRAHV
jgi:hypothetical protein